MSALRAAEIFNEIIGLERKLMKPTTVEERKDISKEIEKLKNQMDEEMKIQ